ncbi:GGDEF domain-containing protein [Eubacterium oxidoreducens]|nr:GGDEF domain-containing protein [Eubacterium oxidoreducens]
MNQTVYAQGTVVGSTSLFLFAIEVAAVICAFIGYCSCNRKSFSWLNRNVYMAVLAGFLDLTAALIHNTLVTLLLFSIAAIAIAWAMLWEEKHTIIWLFGQIGALVCVSMIHGWNSYAVASMVIVQGFAMVIALLAYRSYIRKIHNEYYLRRAVHDAQTDPLTRLCNRRGLEERVSGIWQLCQRHHIPAALLMMDIDDFKKYNDEFGHPAGDACIQMVARQIKKNARRRNDIVARVGGEEFLVVFTGMNMAQVKDRAKAMRDMVYNYKMRHAVAAKYTYVTISMGIAYTDFDSQVEFKELYDQADQNLYQAKQNGKNCICSGKDTTATA